MVTALILLDPKLAIRALFEPGPLDKHHELSIGFIHFCQLSVLLACEIGVHLAFASETVVLLA